MGIDRTYELIGRNYFWPRLYNEVVGLCEQVHNVSIAESG